MDYQNEIIFMVKQMHSQSVLKRIYRYVYRLFIKC